jgi:ectoine hydroxylase-related dioxygenase (phytanoyl-CoA dioxygenase family)
LAHKSLHAGVSFEGAYPEWDLSKFVPLEVKAGTMVLLHGENVHYSAPNTSAVSRHAYSVHFVDGRGLSLAYTRPPFSQL